MKVHLKKILVPLLASRPVSAIATRIFGYGVPIFMIHRTATDRPSSGSHTTSLLRQYLQFLKDRGHHFVSIMDVVNAARGNTVLPPKSVAFTIDDGYLHQAETAAPVFLEFDCPVTIFLITGFLDNKLWPWFSQVAYLVKNSGKDTFELDFPEKQFSYSIPDTMSRSQAIKAVVEKMKFMDDERIPSMIEQLSHRTQVTLPADAPEKYRPMTWDNARDLEKRGVTFGPHTVSHPILSMVNNHKSEREITESWQRVREELSNPVPVFCYPNGRTCDYTEREIEIIRNAGLIGAVSTIPKQVDIDSRSDHYAYNLPRLSLPHSISDLVQYSTWIEHAKVWQNNEPNRY